MHLGIISDVHANAPALNAVLAEMPPVDHVVHAGDVVGYNPYPKEVIGTFQDRNIISIQGNHDRGVLGNFHENFDGIPRAVVEWTQNELDGSEIEFLDALPVSRSLFEGRVKLVHGSPDDPDQYTYPEKYSTELIDEEDVLVLGHTHEQAVETFDERVILNPGSVGQPRDGDPRPGYAVLNLDTLAVTTHRVEYPYKTVQERIRELGLPDALINVIAEGQMVSHEGSRYDQQEDRYENE